MGSLASSSSRFLRILLGGLAWPCACRRSDRDSEVLVVHPNCGLLLDVLHRRVDLLLLKSLLNLAGNVIEFGGAVPRHLEESHRLADIQYLGDFPIFESEDSLFHIRAHASPPSAAGFRFD